MEEFSLTVCYEDHINANILLICIMLGSKSKSNLPFYHIVYCTVSPDSCLIYIFGYCLQMPLLHMSRTRQTKGKETQTNFSFVVTLWRLGDVSWVIAELSQLFFFFFFFLFNASPSLGLNLILKLKY